MAETASQVARTALARAESAHGKIDAHEDLCAERYKNIHDSLRTITRVLFWAGSTLFLLLVGTLGWSLQMQADSARYELRALRSVPADSR